MIYVYTSIMFVYVNTYSYLCIKKMRYLTRWNKDTSPGEANK